jgi:hypothetical protein
MTRRLINGKRRIAPASEAMVLACPTHRERIAACQRDTRVYSLTSNF